MQQYFFDVVAGGTHIERDSDGSRFETLAEARLAAMTLAADLAKEECREWRKLAIAVRVRDQDGNYRYEAALTMTPREMTSKVGGRTPSR